MAKFVLLCFLINQLCGHSSAFQFAHPFLSRILVKESEDAIFLFNYQLGDDEVVTEILFSYKKDKDDDDQYIAVYRPDQISINNESNSEFDKHIRHNIQFYVDSYSNATVVLRSVSYIIDSGLTLYCRIKFNGETKEKSILLEVTNAPVIKSVFSEKVVQEGDPVSLQCQSNGKPPPIMKWYKGDVLIYTSDTRGEATIKFDKVNRTLAGNYTCEAKNIAGSTTATTSVIVQYAPVINLEKSSLRLGSFSGNYELIRLKCVADGMPPPTYKWNNPQKYQGAVGSVYALQQPTTAAHFGKYICEASNKVGSAYHNVEVVKIRKPNPVNITVLSVEARSAKINIKSIDKGNSVLKEIILSYRRKGELNAVKRAINFSETVIVLTQLKPFSIYEINVTIMNEFFTSDGQKKMIKTKQAAPGPPAGIVLDVLSSSSLNVSWETPVEANGEIISYELKFYDKLLTNITIIPMMMLKSKLFGGLKPHTLYAIQVRAYTYVGAGHWSLMVERYTDPEAPGTPQDVFVKVIDFETISLEWKDPLINTSVAATMYNMKLSFFSLEFKKEFNTTVSLTPDPKQGRKYTINTFTPFAKYNLAVREGGGSKPIWGNYSDPVLFEMPEGEPSSVRVRVVDIPHNQLHMKWSRPYPVNGVLQKFIIFYKEGQITHQKEFSNQLQNTTFYYTLSSLEPQTNYQLYVVAYNRLHASAKSNIINITTTGVTVPELLEKKKEKSNMAAILAGCATVIIVVIIGVIVFIYMSRRKRLKHSDGSMSSMSGFLKLSSRDVSPTHALDRMRSKGSIGNGFTSNGKNPGCTFPPLKPIPVTKLKEYVLHHQTNKDRDFIDEFKSIKAEGDFTYEVSARPENKCKNRYANILAYDHSRVVLNTVENLTESDYINANYIDGYNKKAKFIATQGPVAASFSDFWRMVWEQNCNTIVMVTNLIEKSRPKCQKYWPTETEKCQVYGEISVEILDEMELADYVVRRFKVNHNKNGSSKCHKVTHYQFLSWPDHGVPQYVTPLLQFVKRVRTLRMDTTGPIICHCSAGVGRTGTYIVLDAMLEQIETEKLVDVFGFISHIRGQRNFLVQTEPQYVFIYNALLESVLCGNTEINTSDLPARIKHLNSLNPASSRTYMQEEYERLDLNMSSGHHYESSALICNKLKNRFQDKLPYETSRVKLWPYPNIEGSDYINGSFLDGYQQREAYILTQAPLENTIHDFWRMVWEYEVLSIVMISSVKERDMHHCYPYWPENNDATLFGLLRVQIAAEEERKGYIKREFRVTNSKNGETRLVTHFMYFNWLSNSEPDCTNIIDMIGALQKTQQQTGNNSVIVHCSDGCGRSGSLVALMFCLERLKLEGTLDVFQTVRTMRTQRTAIVQSLEQYQFVYKAVRNFLDCFSNYANFK